MAQLGDLVRANLVSRCLQLTNLIVNSQQILSVNPHLVISGRFRYLSIGHRQSAFSPGEASGLMLV